MTSYKIDVQTSAMDRKMLADNKYNLAVAKIVKDGDNDATPNIIFQERGGKNADTSIAWEEVYGINYITDLPSKGAKVTGSGVWTKCDIGQGLELNEEGSFIYVDGKGKTALNVVNSHGEPINVIIGIQDQTTSEWLPIYVTENKLLNGVTGQFTPTPKVQLWYGSEQRESHMIALLDTKVKTYPVVADTLHYFHYDANGGNWADQTTPFKLDQTPPPANLVRVTQVAYVPGMVRMLLFTKNVLSVDSFEATFKKDMLTRGWYAEVRLTKKDYEFKITAARKIGTETADAFADDLDRDIEASILVTQRNGDVPRDDPHTLSAGSLAALENKPAHKRVDSGTVERADIAV